MRVKRDSRMQLGELLENNIGFFSKSKGAESLIADVQQKIERAKRDMAETIEKIRVIDAEEAKNE